MDQTLTPGGWAVIVATVATAIFTGIQMWVSLLARSDQIAVDFQFVQGVTIPDAVAGGDPVVVPGKYIVKASVRNLSNRTVMIQALEVTGAPLSWIDTYNDEIVRCHGGLKRTADIDVPTGTARDIHLGVLVDLPKFKDSYSSGTRGAKLRASVIIDRNSFPNRIVSRRQSKLIAEEIAIQTAETTTKT